jgi:hypothetical protein
VTPQEKAQFDLTFHSFDPDRTGFIDGLRAQQCFALSGVQEGIHFFT